VLTGLAILCYMVLRELGESRVVAIAIAIVYSLSPRVRGTWLSAMVELHAEIRFHLLAV